jgi:hypothetical protein
VTTTTRVDVRAQLDRVSYRPGWKIEYHEGDWGDGWIVVRAKVPDTYDPGREVEILHTGRVPSYLLDDDEETFIHWLAHFLQGVERHESREWFRVDGAIYDDPHKDGGW